MRIRERADVKKESRLSGLTPNYIRGKVRARMSMIRVAMQGPPGALIKDKPDGDGTLDELDWQPPAPV